MGFDAFETQFQRDKDALREAGAHLSIGSGERYSIERDSFAPSIEITSADRALISLAAHVWEGGEILADSIDAKTAAGTRDDASAPLIRLGLSGLIPATQFARGIRDRLVVTFTYPGSAGLTERSVDPWALTVQGRALYLWGWDLDREAERTFRLSRVSSPVGFIGQPGDASMAPAGAVPPRVSTLVAPRVHVRAESNARMVLLGYEAGAGRDGEPAPRRGWHALCLEDAELGTWIARLLPLAGDVIVVSPPPLREAILERLATAATWGGRHA